MDLTLCSKRVKEGICHADLTPSILQEVLFCCCLQESPRSFPGFRELLTCGRSVGMYRMLVAFMGMIYSVHTTCISSQDVQWGDVYSDESLGVITGNQVLCAANWPWITNRSFFFFHQQRVRLSKTQERDVSLKQRGIWSWLSSTQTFASLRTVNWMSTRAGGTQAGKPSGDSCFLSVKTSSYPFSWTRKLKLLVPMGRAQHWDSGELPAYPGGGISEHPIEL